MTMEFCRLVQYDKKKSKKYKNNVDIFLKKANTLFDIYQHDPKHFSDTEKKMLKMTESDFQFYDDQKTTRVQYCTLKQIPPSSSNLKFKNRVIHSQRMETEIVSNALLMEIADFADSEMENCAESNSNIDFVPSKDLLQNQRSLQALAEACDRYHINDRAGAAIACDFG